MFNHSNDIMGNALLDYYNGDEKAEIIINNYVKTRKHNFIKGYNVLSVRDLIKEINELETIDKMAIEKCYGKVLDIGAGGGSHSLALLNKKCDVISLDISKGAIAVMRKRGLQNLELMDINFYKEKSFDTLVFFGNNHGMFGNIRKLIKFIKNSFKRGLLNYDGQIIISSPFVDIPIVNNYNFHKYEILEMKIQLEYKGDKSKKSAWMMASPTYLCKRLEAAGFRTKRYYCDSKSSCLLKIIKP